MAFRGGVGSCSPDSFPHIFVAQTCLKIGGSQAFICCCYHSYNSKGSLNMGRPRGRGGGAGGGVDEVFL